MNVRVLLADPGWIDANAKAATFLAAHGIAATEAANVTLMHATLEKDWATATPF